MHEFSLMSQIFEIINQTVEANDIKQVKKVNLQVGKMANVVPDTLSFCFEILSQGTKCQGAELVMESVPLTVICRVCNETFVGEGFPLICPTCGSRDTNIIGGTQISVASLEFTEEVENDGS